MRDQHDHQAMPSCAPATLSSPARTPCERLFAIISVTDRPGHDDDHDACDEVGEVDFRRHLQTSSRAPAVPASVSSQIVALADLDALVAQDVVGSRDVEEEVRKANCARGSCCPFSVRGCPPTVSVMSFSSDPSISCAGTLLMKSRVLAIRAFSSSKVVSVSSNFGISRPDSRAVAPFA